jgi:hypothetical protein
MAAPLPRQGSNFAFALPRATTLALIRAPTAGFGLFRKRCIAKTNASVNFSDSPTIESPARAAELTRKITMTQQRFTRMATMHQVHWLCGHSNLSISSDNQYCR